MIDEKDLKIDEYRTSEPENPIDPDIRVGYAIRITHIPTGYQVQVKGENCRISERKETAIKAINFLNDNIEKYGDVDELISQLNLEVPGKLFRAGKPEDYKE